MRGVELIIDEEVTIERMFQAIEKYKVIPIQFMYMNFVYFPARVELEQIFKLLYIN